MATIREIANRLNLHDKKFKINHMNRKLNTLSILAIITFLLAGSVFIFLPHHFSLSAALLMFSAVTIFIFRKNDKFTKSIILRYTNIVMVMTASLWSYVSIMMHNRNARGGCSGFWGSQIVCYDRKDFSYILLESALTIIAFIILLTVSGVVVSAIRKNKNR